MKSKKKKSGGSGLGQYMFLIHELTQREIKRKYARSYLGVVWSVLNPLLSMAVTTLVFSTLFHRYITNFPVYYLSGIMIWSLFSGGTSASLTSLVDNKTMMFSAGLPKQIFIISRIYTAMTNFLFSFIAFMIIIPITGARFSVYFLLWFVILLLMLLFTLGVSYLMSILYTYFADIKHLYSVFLGMLHWFCAIFYPVDNLHPVAVRIIEANPLYAFIKAGRIITLECRMPEMSMWYQMIIWSLSVFLFGYLVFKRKEGEIPALV